MYFLMLDSETCNTLVVDGQLDVANGQVYDLGGKVIDEFGNEYERFSVVNEDVFFGMTDQMNEAYYSAKIPQYLHDIRQGTRKVVNTWQMWKIVRDLCTKWHIQAVVAHNARFDMCVLNSTLRYQTKSMKRYFLPYNMRVIDTMKLAKRVYGQNVEYQNFCRENNLMTNHKTPRPKLTAEALYRFISQQKDFVESHTGFEDVEIESVIFTKCLEALRAK